MKTLEFVDPFTGRDYVMSSGGDMPFDIALFPRDLLLKISEADDASFPTNVGISL